MHSFFFFFLGLIFGSFINALVYREHENVSPWGRSFCPHCRKLIAWYDNIPLLGFLFLGGRCRRCHRKISWRYPVVELLTGTAFLLAVSSYQQGSLGNFSEMLWLLFLTVLFIALAAYDFQYMEVPIAWVLTGMVVTVIFLLFSGPIFEWPSPLILGLAGGAALSFLFFLLVFFSRETWMGRGDVWLGFLSGLVVGLPAILFLLTLSSSLGALTGLGLMLAGRKKMKSALPFVPFLALGTLATLYLARLFPGALSFFFI